MIAILYRFNIEVTRVPFETIFYIHLCILLNRKINHRQLPLSSLCRLSFILYKYDFEEE